MQTQNVTERLGLNQWLSDDPLNTAQFTEDNRLVDSKVAVLSQLGATGWDNRNLTIEQGTWVPSVGGETTDGTGSISVNGYSSGTYYKIGKHVFISYRLSGWNPTVKPTGALCLTGLPFPIASGLRDCAAEYSTMANLSAPTGVETTSVGLGLLPPNKIRFYFKAKIAGNKIGYGNCTGDNLNNGFGIWGSASYITTI